jgi:hypothetical protein
MSMRRAGIAARRRESGAITANTSFRTLEVSITLVRCVIGISAELSKSPRTGAGASANNDVAR